MITSKDIQAQDVMSPMPQCLEHDSTLAEAARMLTDWSVTGAPVVARDGTTLSVLSKSDLLRAITEVLFRGLERDVIEMEALGSRSVGSLVQRSAITCTEQDSLADICRQMIRERVHRVVVTCGHEPVGIVSAIDVVRSLACISDLDLGD